MEDKYSFNTYFLPPEVIPQSKFSGSLTRGELWRSTLSALTYVIHKFNELPDRVNTKDLLVVEEIKQQIEKEALKFREEFDGLSWHFYDESEPGFIENERAKLEDAIQKLLIYEEKELVYHIFTITNKDITNKDICFWIGQQQFLGTLTEWVVRFCHAFQIPQYQDINRITAELKCRIPEEYLIPEIGGYMQLYQDRYTIDRSSEQQEMQSPTIQETFSDIDNYFGYKPNTGSFQVEESILLQNGKPKVKVITTIDEWGFEVQSSVPIEDTSFTDIYPNCVDIQQQFKVADRETKPPRAVNDFGYFFKENNHIGKQELRINTVSIKQVVLRLVCNITEDPIKDFH